jgi:hypothetical protein
MTWNGISPLITASEIITHGALSPWRALQPAARLAWRTAWGSLARELVIPFRRCRLFHTPREAGRCLILCGPPLKELSPRSGDREVAMIVSPSSLPAIARTMGARQYRGPQGGERWRPKRCRITSSCPLEGGEASRSLRAHPNTVRPGWEASGKDADGSLLAAAMGAATAGSARSSDLTPAGQPLHCHSPLPTALIAAPRSGSMAPRLDHEDRPMMRASVSAFAVFGLSVGRDCR